jgi:hypothetical protein
MALDSQATDRKGSNAPRRSFFKKPKWAAPTESSTRTDFYRRADQTYVDIVAAKPRQLQKPHEHPKNFERGDGGRELGEVKRRRILDSKPEELTPQPSSYLPQEEEVSPGSPEGSKPHDEEDFLQSPRSARGHDPAPSARQPITQPITHQPTTHKTLDKATVIDLETEVFEARINAAPDLSGEELKSELDEDLLLEEEFPELARKARERAQKSLTGLKNGGSLPDNVSNNVPPVTSPDSSITPSATGGTDVVRKEPIARILITSSLKNTKPLIVQRKLSQRLRDVRIAWCRRQGFNEETTATVFLTWKGTRLFDVTTCNSLGVQNTSDNDPLFMEGDGSNEEEIHIHMEAVTEDILESEKRQTVRGSVEPVDDSGDEVEAEQRVRLTLKSPEFEEFRLIVKPATQISRIISTFRKARNIPPDSTIHLLFDGERLNPGSFVQDNDITDLDSIDAQVK